MTSTMGFEITCFDEMKNEELMTLDGGVNWREAARYGYSGALGGGAGGAAAGIYCGMIGFPVTAGASIPTCAAVGFTGGFISGGVSGFVGNVVYQLLQ